MFITPHLPKIIQNKKEIYSSITEIYGKNNADEIYNKVIEQADKAISERSEELINQDKIRKSDWYKKRNYLYVLC